MMERCIKDTCMFYRCSLIAAIALNLVLVATPAYALDRFIIVASTTSAQDSGLFDYLLPIFKQKTGITVMVWAQGSRDALDTARRGKADVVLVHSKSAEEKFIAEGEGVKLFPVMYNEFVLIGPKDDPAGIKGMNDAAEAFQVIKQKQACFVSRGDYSGTHIAELNLWKDAHTDIEKDWLISPDGQKTISDYKIDGQQLFYPDANQPNRLIIWLTYQWAGFTGEFPGWADLIAFGVLLVALTAGAAAKRQHTVHQ
jgi:ABC-type tungstate transport system permease subunit